MKSNTNIDHDTARENILRRLRQSQPTKTTLADITIKTATADLLEIFSVEFALAAGQLHLVAATQNLPEFISQLCAQNQWHSLYCPEEKIKNLLPPLLLNTKDKQEEAAQADAAFTSCQALIAEFGAVLVQAQAQTRKATVLAPNHVIIAYPQQLVYTIAEALANSPASSMQSIITGPSRTADIEKTLVMGAHGSKTLHLILII